MVTMYQSIGLQMKVSKHLAKGELEKAAFYFVTRSQRDGKPEEGSAEHEEMEQLKAAGYKFKKSPDGEVLCIRPNGKLYSGRDALADWNALFQ